MHTVLVTPDQMQRATGFYEFGALRNSITAGRSNVYGAIGEVVFADLFPVWSKVESFNHDFIDGRGRTVDIKTKRTTQRPQPHWNCSSAATSKHQRPDYLMFIRVHEDLSVLWVLGWLPLDEFYDVAVFARRGDPDPEYGGAPGGRGWAFAADCYNVRVDQLRAPVGLEHEASARLRIL